MKKILAPETLSSTQISWYRAQILFTNIFPQYIMRFWEKTKRRNFDIFSEIHFKGWRAWRETPKDSFQIIFFPFPIILQTIKIRKKNVKNWEGMNSSPLSSLSWKYSLTYLTFGKIEINLKILNFDKFEN